MEMIFVSTAEPIICYTFSLQIWDHSPQLPWHMMMLLAIVLTQQWWSSGVGNRKWCSGKEQFKANQFWDLSIPTADLKKDITVH